MELKTARTLARLTQKQLAASSGVDDSLISKVENGDRDILDMAYASVVRLARDGLGVDNPLDVFPVPPVTPGGN